MDCEGTNSAEGIQEAVETVVKGEDRRTRGGNCEILLPHIVVNFTNSVCKGSGQPTLILPPPTDARGLAKDQKRWAIKLILYRSH